MPKSEPSYTPYYPRAPERHVFSPENSFSPELQILSGSLPHSLHVCDTHSGHSEHPNGEDNISDSSEDSNRTLNDSRPVSPAISVGSSELSIEEDVIPKPKGAIGRPRSGGYSLFQVLGWEPEDYRETQAYFRSLAQEYLNESVSFSAQDPKVIAELCRQADIKFPRLKSYKDRWATKDFLASYHKNSAPGTSRNLVRRYRPSIFKLPGFSQCPFRQARRKPSPHPSGGTQMRASSSKPKTVTFEGEDNETVHMPINLAVRKSLHGMR